jgi:hypothetical protein
MPLFDFVTGGIGKERLEKHLQRSRKEERRSRVGRGAKDEDWVVDLPVSGGHLQIDNPHIRQMSNVVAKQTVNRMCLRSACACFVILL